jgi:hypothetical protein
MFMKENARAGCMHASAYFGLWVALLVALSMGWALMDGRFE